MSSGTYEGGRSKYRSVRHKYGGEARGNMLQGEPLAQLKVCQQRRVEIGSGGRRASRSVKLEGGVSRGAPDQTGEWLKCLINALNCYSN